MATYKLVNADQLDADLESVADSIRTKAGKTEKLAFPDGFKSIVDGISTGVTVQVKTGTVTGVSGTAKTVNLGFKPDAVFFTGTDPSYNTKIHAGVAFMEANVTSMDTYFVPSSTSYIFSALTVAQTSTGFTVKGVRINTSLQVSNESNRSLSYIAIKYS